MILENIKKIQLGLAFVTALIVGFVMIKEKGIHPRIDSIINKNKFLYVIFLLLFASIVFIGPLIGGPIEKGIGKLNFPPILCYIIGIIVATLIVMSIQKFFLK